MKKTKLPSLIAVLILTLITVVMWVSLDIYRAFTKNPESVVSSDITKSLIPTLDQDSIKLVESRTLIPDSEIPEDIISSSPTPKVVPTTEPSVQPTEATESGISI